MNRAPRTLVIGLGNLCRGDDGAGPVAARRLRDLALPDLEVREESGEGAALMEAWKNADAVILIDAAQSGAVPGTIHRLDASERPVPSRLFHYSTHAFSVAEAVELARALDQLPPRLILYGIEGRDFRAGEKLSPEIEAAVDELVRRVRMDCAVVHRRPAGSPN
ncbi:MAG: hydrogenase maturation protease [Verrucomicrobiota bacterium]|nr:hydrogenase maturation protease [Verrucomicrobiota bacterium]